MHLRPFSKLRRFSKLHGASLAVLTLLYMSPQCGSEIASTSALQAPENSISSGPSGDKRIALTFDDGPHPVITPKVLEELRVRNVKATFFVLGERVKLYPEVLQQIFAEGHEIGNHTY